MIKAVATAFAVGMLACLSVAHAQPAPRPVRIMLMADQSGPYQDASGPGGVVAARIAARELGDAVLGRPVEVIAGDHKNKADVGLALARSFYTEQDGDLIVDIGNSAISLAIQELARSTGKMVIHVGSAHADLYGKFCSPVGAMWLYDTASLSSALTRAVTGIGLKDWFIVAADYAAGNALVADETRQLAALGGRVVGVYRQPVGTSDFSAQLLEAQSSGASVLALAVFGHDAENMIKQAAEFHIRQRIVGPILDLATLRGLGPAATGVLALAEFYWNENDATRAFGRQFGALFGGKMPTDIQAADYSAVRHYLRAIAASGTTDAVAVMRQMKAMPVDDVYGQGARLREDGRLLNEMMLVEVKAAADRTTEWDAFRIVGRVSAADGIRPLIDGGCPMVGSGK